MRKQSITVHVVRQRMCHIHGNLGNSYRNGLEHNNAVTDSMNSMVLSCIMGPEVSSYQHNSPMTSQSVLFIRNIILKIPQLDVL
jgi:hypothetical protein